MAPDEFALAYLVKNRVFDVNDPLWTKFVKLQHWAKNNMPELYEHMPKNYSPLHLYESYTLLSNLLFSNVFDKCNNTRIETIILNNPLKEYMRGKTFEHDGVAYTVHSPAYTTKDIDAVILNNGETYTLADLYVYIASECAGRIPGYPGLFIKETTPMTPRWVGLSEVINKRVASTIELRYTFSLYTEMVDKKVRSVEYVNGEYIKGTIQVPKYINSNKVIVMSSDAY